MRTLKMKLLGLLSLITLTGNYAVGQSTTLEIRYSDSAELTINEYQINSKANIEQLIESLGEPSKIMDYPSGEKSYFYDEIGIVFFTMDGLVKGLGINFNWDGDEKFPEQTFKGILKLGESEVTKETESEFIAAINSVEFICPIPMMCASKDRQAKINCTVAFKDKTLTQVAFIIK